MGYSLVSVWKHPATGKPWYRKTTPRDLFDRRNDLYAMGIVVTREFKHPLKTDKGKAPPDDDEAEALWTKAHDACLAKISAMRKALENGPATLTNKQVTALAANIARQLIARDDDLSDASVEWKGAGKIKVTWGHTADLLQLIVDNGLDGYPSVNAIVDQLTTHVLLKHGIIAIDNQSSQQLKARIVKDLPRVAKMLAAMQDDGNYREPEWVKDRLTVREAFPLQLKKVTFAQLIEGWIKDKRPKAASVQAYRVKVNAFIKWAGNDDAANLTRAKMLAWKEFLQSDPDANGRGINVKLESVRGLIEWGIVNEKLPYRENPCRGIKVDVDKSDKQGWPEDVARMILIEARKQKDYLRWGTWLMAWTGARATEIAQLRLGDFVEDEQGQWSITITDEAGAVKTNQSKRTVPLHSSLVAEGLPIYLRELGHGDSAKAQQRVFSQFYSSDDVADTKVAREALANAVSGKSGDVMRRWLYGKHVGLKPDKRYSPRHAWRHRLATLMREHCAESSEERLIGILGHAKTSTTSRYGKALPVKWLREGVESIPAVKI